MTTQATIHKISEVLKSLDAGSPEYASQFVDDLLRSALASGASDVHLQPIDQAYRPVGCDACQGIGYHGRLAVAELLTPEPTELGRAILSRRSADELQQLAEQSGLVTCWQRALQAVRLGETTPAEVRRVFGLVNAN